MAQNLVQKVTVKKRQTQDTLLLGKALACPVMPISTGAIGVKDPKIVKRKKK